MRALALAPAALGATVPLAFNGYQRRNRYDTWRFERAQGNYTISQPTFVLYPTRDPVADWAGVALALGSYKFLTNHYNAVSESLYVLNIP